MKLTKIYLLGILLVGLFACTSDQQTSHSAEDHNHEGHAHHHDHGQTVVSSKVDLPYTGHGLGFTIPKGWSKVETPIMDVGFLVMIEKEGDDESGQFMISILDGDKLPLNAYMESMIGEITKSLEMQGIKGTFTPTRTEKFNGIDVYICEYQHKSGGLDFSGSLKTFNCNGNTIYLFTQTEKEDFAKNEKGIKLMEETFVCSPN